MSGHEKSYLSCRYFQWISHLTRSTSLIKLNLKMPTWYQFNREKCFGVSFFSILRRFLPKLVDPVPISCRYTAASGGSTDYRSWTTLFPHKKNKSHIITMQYGGILFIDIFALIPTQVCKKDMVYKFTLLGCQTKMN